MIARTEYLAQIEPFIDQDVVKVLVGMRRCGKSTLLDEVRSLLADRGIPPRNIIAMNFESMKWQGLTDSPQALYDEIVTMTDGVEGKIYLFFDEIQTVSDWERAINSLRVDLDCDIYLTGSNSKLLSGELATLLAGRYVTFEVAPFSLRELVRAFPDKDRSALYDEYRIYGGLPFLSHIDYTPESSLSYLQDVFNSIVLKDILQRHGFRNSDQAERLLTYFMSEIGTTYSVDNIVNALKQERRTISNDSVYNYLQAAEDAMLLSRVKRYDVKGKAILRGSEKVYVSDVGLREALVGSNARRVDLVLENIVFLELKRRGYDAFIGKVGKKEIDFIAQRRSEKLYIQVAYLLESETTRDREFSAFEGIDDAYPRYVISTDTVDWSQDGVIHWNIIDFLLAESW